MQKKKVFLEVNPLKNNVIFAVNIDDMQRSYLKNKSEFLEASAELLNDKCLYPGVAHAAYYSCFQLMKNIYLFVMGKSEQDLDSGVIQSSFGVHEFILKEVASFIQVKDSEASRLLRNKMPQLKRYRVKADYKNEEFNSDDSNKSILLSKEILKILKKY